MALCRQYPVSWIQKGGFQAKQRATKILPYRGLGPSWPFRLRLKKLWKIMVCSDLITRSVTLLAVSTYHLAASAAVFNRLSLLREAPPVNTFKTLDGIFQQGFYDPMLRSLSDPVFDRYDQIGPCGWSGKGLAALNCLDCMGVKYVVSGTLQHPDVFCTAVVVYGKRDRHLAFPAHSSSLDGITQSLEYSIPDIAKIGGKIASAAVSSSAVTGAQPTPGARAGAGLSSRETDLAISACTARTVARRTYGFFTGKVCRPTERL